MLWGWLCCQIHDKDTPRMKDSSLTWLMSELNKKLFFSAYSKRVNHQVWVKSSREGRRWLIHNDPNGLWSKLPEINYGPQHRTLNIIDFSDFPKQPMTHKEIQDEVTWQQRYFFESEKTKGALCTKHPAIFKTDRKPDIKRTQQLVYSLYLSLCNTPS